MEFKLEKNSEQAIMLVTIAGEAWTKAIAKSERKQMEGITVPGFRKGKAPEDLVKKYVSAEKVTTDAINSLSDDAYKFAMAQEEVQKLNLISSPTLSVREISETNVVLEFKADILPEVKIGDYKSIKVEMESDQVTDEEIENVLSNITKQFSIQTPKEGEIKSGDVAIFDFEGFKDGEAFAGGKAENYELKIGSGQFIPGFEDQMIGMKAGESKDINVSFPKDYHVDSLAGAPVVFKVKVHSIKEAKEERNDEVAAKVGIPGVSTWAELELRVKEDVQKQKSANEKQKAEVKIMEQVVEKLEMNIPSSMLEKEKENLFEQFSSQVQQQKMTMETYMKNSGMDKEKILAELEQDAIARIKTQFALAEIAKIENIQVENKDVEEYYSQLSAQYGMEVEAVKKAIPQDSIMFRLQNQKVIDFLFANATK